MGDLKTQSTSYGSEVLDTATSCADGSVSGDEIVAAMFNGIYGAVVAIENKLGVTTATNPSIKGTCASLAARLAYNTAAGGGIPSGTAFPTSPTPVDGQFFKRNDYSPTRLYFYDSSTAAWVRFSALLNHSDLGGLTSGDDHTQYVHNTTARTISANHTFSGTPVFSGNPVLSGTPSFSHATGVSPFTVTSTTKVDNLHVSKLTTAEAIVSTLATGTAPLTVASTTKVTNLNADLLDDMNSATTNTASTIVARDASGNFAAGTITAALTGNVTGNVSGNADTVDSLHATDNAGQHATAYRGGSNQSLTSGVGAKVALNAEAFDDSGVFDSTTNYWFQPTVAGYYLATGTVWVTASGGITDATALLYANGTLIAYTFLAKDSTGNYATGSISKIHAFNGSSTFMELYVTVSGAGTVEVVYGQEKTFLSVGRLK